jgi:mxaJ protein
VHQPGEGKLAAPLLQRLKDSLERNHTAISAILAEYHVPVLPDAFAPR